MSTPTAPLVSTDITTATPEEIAKVNASWKRERLSGRIPPTTEEAISRAESLQRAGPTILRPYLEHPDDRVPLALLANPSRPWGSRANEQMMALSLYFRALKSMDASGTVWNPLLDSMHRHKIWPETVSLDAHHDEQKKRQAAGEPFDAESLNVSHRYAHEVLQPVSSYLEESGDEQYALHLSEIFQSSAVMRTIIRSAPLTPAIESLAYQNLAELPLLLKNSTISEEVRGRLLSWAQEQIKDGEIESAPSPEAKAAIEIFRSALRGEKKENETGEAPAYVLEALERLSATTTSRVAGGTLRHSLQWTVTDGAHYLDPEQMERAYERLKSNPILVTYLFKQPGMTNSLLRRIHEEMKQYPQVRRELSRNPDALKDEVIGSHLGTLGGDTQQEILRNGTGVAFRLAFQRLIAKNSAAAISAASRRLGDVALDLRPEDLERALRSRVHSIKQPAIRIEQVLACLHSAEGDLEAPLRMLLKENPQSLLLVLEKLPASHFASLPRDLWSEMLSQGDTETRMAVIRKIGEATRDSQDSGVSTAPEALQQSAASPRKSPSR